MTRFESDPQWDRVERPILVRHPGVDERDDHDLSIVQMITIGVSDTAIAGIGSLGPNS